MGVEGLELELGKVVTWVLESYFMVCLCAEVQTWGKKGLAEASYAWQEGHVNSHGRLACCRKAHRQVGS